MSGDEHVELVVGTDGSYRVWISDARRRPIEKDVGGKLVVTAPTGDTETIPRTGPAEGGVLTGKGKPRVGEVRTVSLEGTARGVPIMAGFVLSPEARAGRGTTIEMEITESGIVPESVIVRGGEEVRLRITRRTEKTCAKEFIVPGLVARTELPLGKPVEVAFTPAKSGAIRYGCSMNQMVGGTLVVE
jgi:hypothetical protein